jgi:phosphotransacetylase
MMSLFSRISTKELQQVLDLARQIEKKGFGVQISIPLARKNGVLRKQNAESAGPRIRFSKNYARAQKAYWKQIKTLMKSKGLTRQDARKVYRQQRDTVNA